MKLFFDARWIRTDYHDGVSRYTYEIAQALAKQQAVTFIVSSDEQAKLLPKEGEVVKIHHVDSLLEPFTSLRLNKYKPDIVVSPMQTMGSFGRRFKLILTLHDMIYYKHRLPPPQAKGLIRPLWRLFHMWYWPQRLVLNGADIVATVSETSRKEIFDAKLTRRHLIVVSNAARDLTPLLVRPVAQTEHPPKNLVYMGTPLPYKNSETLIKAMQYLPGRTLHICSKISEARQAQLTKLTPEGANVIFHGGISDEAYANLLASESIMVSASLAEGYGLPLAEALQLGVPAVVSDRPYFREIAGADGAVYSDPTNAKAFAEAIIRLDDLAVRRRYVDAGKFAVNKFSWDDSAKVLLESCFQLTSRPNS
jgi:glycosyltransferase involved in cell wall biosynthesis